ncbi:MAG TPA: Ig-like domain-containing protein [Chitinophaga sp.]|uniref:Ig-like domain-containing protein n=1 Tax=Chitinophaga sp. TaxID=1869181 RepID=UPI002BDBC785|nr:Ig-like domain-containing protein [Chitinophaga sp.]HVI45061.1 Ig-like domain-containing protein [Chitinophaga sp.]
MSNPIIGRSRWCWLLLTMLLFSLRSVAQYTTTVLESGGRYTSVARDASNNLYVIRLNAAKDKYDVVKYINANPANKVTIYAGLPFAGSPTHAYPNGIAINSHGDVFVIGALNDSNGKIIKLTYNGGNSYSPNVVQSGKYYTAITIDNSDNVLVMEWDAAASLYILKRYPAGTEQNAGTTVYSGLSIPSSNISYPYGIAVDNFNNIYILDFQGHAGGGQVIKLGGTPTYYYTGRFFTGITFDAANNAYLTEVFNGTTQGRVVKVKDFSQPPQIINNTLSASLWLYPWGIAVDDNGSKVYVASPVSASDGDLLQISPPSLTVTGVTCMDANPTQSNTLHYKVTFSGTPDADPTAAAFSLNTTGLTGASVFAVVNSGAFYTVTVNTGTGDGTLRLDVTGNGMINPLTNAPYNGEVYTIDHTAPTGTLNINSGALFTNNTAVTLNITASDADATLKMSFSNDNTTFNTPVTVAPTSPWTLTAGDGLKTVYMRLTDRAGNTGTIQQTITLDQTAPIPSYTAKPAAVSSISNGIFGFTANEPSTFDIRLDGGATITNVTSPYTFNNLTNASHTVEVRAKDQAGNYSGWLPYTWTVDAPLSVTSVNVPANASYRTGTNLDFTVNYPAPVTVTGTPSLPLTIGATVVQANYVSGSGTTALLFRYTVLAGQEDPDGVAVGAALQLNAGTIKSASGTDALLTLNNVAPTTNVLVHTAIPTVVLSTTATSPLNHAFTVTAVFSESVTGFTVGDLISINATASGLTTTDNITYTFTETPAVDGTITIRVLAGGVQNVAGSVNLASNTLTIDYDHTAPSVSRVDVPVDGYYKASQTMNFIVKYNEAVTVTGIPSLPVIIGSSTVQATYTGGSGSTDLTFSYTVQNGDMDMNGITLGSALALNGGTIRDAATNDAALTLSNVGNTSNVKVNTARPTVTVSSTAVSPVNNTVSAKIVFSEAVTGFTQGDITVSNCTLANLQTADNITYTIDVTPLVDGTMTVQVPAAVAVNIAGNDNQASNTLSITADLTPPVTVSVDVPPNGQHNSNESLNFTVHFSEAVTVTGTPFLPLTIGSSNVQASYVFGSGSNALVFRYDIQVGDMDLDGIVLGNAITLNGGSIRDAAGNNTATALNNAAPTTGVLVNTATPGVTLSTTAVSPINQPFTVTAVFSEIVTGLTASGFNIVNGTASNLATTDNITYTILVTPAVDGTVTVTLPANAAQNLAVTGNSASNTLTLTYDHTAPVVSSVGVPSNGVYKAGIQLDFTVQFSEAVNVVGAPSLPVTIGSSTVQAVYTGGTGTATLQFRYTVQNGDNDANGISLGTALQTNGGSIKDAAGNNAVLTLNGMPSTAGVIINTATPSVVLSTTAVSPLNHAFTVTAVFSEKVTGLTAGSINVTNGAASGLLTADNITYTFTVTPSADGSVNITLPAGSAQNNAGTTNTASNTLTVDYDHTAPAVSGVSVPPNGYYRLGDALSFTVKYNEPVTVTGTPSLPVTIGSSVVQAAYTGGSGSTDLTFSYTVQNGDMDMDGITLGNALVLNGGTIKDNADNNALLTLNNVANTSAVKVNTARPTVTVTTTAVSPVTGTFNVKITFSEAVTGFVLGDITPTNATAANLQTADNITFTVDITPSADGAVTLQIPAAAAVNIAGNDNQASNTLSITADITAPVTTSVAVPANGYYKNGDVLNFTVSFSEAVTVTGTPAIPLTIGSSNVQATYASGSGANNLVFRYNIQPGDMDLDGIAVGNALALNGGAIRDAAGNNTVTTLNNVSPTTSVFVNTATPNVTLTTSAASPLNQPFTVTAVFSELVTGLTAGSFNITNCTASNLATTDNITYTILVTPSADGTVTVGLPAGSARNNAGTDNTVSNTLTLTYDHTAPVVNSVGVPSNGGYKAGTQLDFTVQFSEAVNVTGAPSLPIIIGSSIVQAVYTSGTGTATLHFRYTVQNGDNDADGISLGAALQLNGGAIKDAAGNNAVLTLNGAPSTSGIIINTATPSVVLTTTAVSPLNHAFTVTAVFSEKVAGLSAGGINAANATVSALLTTDNITYTFTVTPSADGNVNITLPAGSAQNTAGTVNTASNILTVAYDHTAPSVVRVDVPANGYYSVGQTLTFTVKYSEAVTVTGTPSLPVTIGSSVVQAAYTGGSGGTDLTFSYAVQNGDMDMDGITPGSALALNGGTIRDAAGNNAVLTLNNVGNTSGVNVNTLQPTVVVSTTAVSPVNGAFAVKVTFSEAVTGFTLGDINLANGTVASLQTSDNITYTVTATPSADGTVTIQVPAAAAVNIGGNNNLASNILSITADLTAPVTTSVDVPANGYYKGGQVLNFTVHFSEAVTVTGTPAVPLTIGSSNVQASYVSGSGSNALVFRYAIQAGDMDLDGIAVGSALALNGGSIRDAAGNNTVATLNNVAATTGVFVNTATPGVTLSTSAASPLNQPFTVTAVFTEKVTGLTVAGFNITNGTASGLTTTDNITYTIQVTPAADGTVAVSLPANVTQNTAATGNTASNTLTLTYDHTAPVVTNVGVPSNGAYKAGAQLDFTVQFSEPVNVTGTPSLPVTIGSSTVQAVYASGTGTATLHFSYTVQNGDNDADGITLGTALQLNGGAIKDAAGNNAVLTLNGVPSTNGIIINTKRPSVSITTGAANRINTPFGITLTCSEAVTGLNAAAISVNNGAATNLQTTDNITYTALITPGADGTVTVQLPAGVAVNNAGNSNTASNTISLTYDATPPVITAGQSFDVFDNATVGTLVGKITATDVYGTIQNWALVSDDSNGALALDAAGNITVKNSTVLKGLAGTSVTLTVTTSDGLNTTVAIPVTVRINVFFVNKQPVLDPVTDAYLCATTTAQTIRLTGASPVETNQTYTLSVKADQPYFDVLTVDAAAGTLRYQLKSGVTSGVAAITVTIKDNGGTDNGGKDTFSRTFYLTINSLPVITISSDKGLNISKGDIVTLTAEGASSYTWDAAAGIIGDRQQPVLKVRPMVNTPYQVTGLNAAGCTAVAKVTITVMEDFKVDATNLLTPNGDGRNDKWVIRNIDSYPDNEVRIFDRSGRLIYQRRNYNNEWDGTLNGHPLAEGTYYYTLTVSGSSKVWKGYITIIRDNY